MVHFVTQQHTRNLAGVATYGRLFETDFTLVLRLLYIQLYFIYKDIYVYIYIYIIYMYIHTHIYYYKLEFEMGYR